jgi:hypothetical protein
VRDAILVSLADMASEIEDLLRPIGAAPAWFDTIETLELRFEFIEGEARIALEDLRSRSR